MAVSPGVVQRKAENKMTDPRSPSLPPQHGVNCFKVQHTGAGYLHGDDDDRPYLPARRASRQSENEDRDLARVDTTDG